MHLLQCLYSTDATTLAATTNHRRLSRTHDVWKFQAKLLFLWRSSHWYQSWEFPTLLTISARC